MKVVVLRCCRDAAEQAVGAEAKGTIFLKNVQTRFPEMLRNIFDSSP
jgi:hypothetical protein